MKYIYCFFYTFHVYSLIERIDKIEFASQEFSLESKIEHHSQILSIEEEIKKSHTSVGKEFKITNYIFLREE